MSQSDWADLTGGLTADQVARGPTAGMAAPNGGGSHVFGFRSVDNGVGAVGKYCVQQNFNPIAANRGGRITGAMKRPDGGTTQGFCPFFFFAAQAQSVTAVAYLLGLSDEAQSHIELRKGQIVDGLPAPALIQPNVSPNILMRSTDTFPADLWQHLRLDVIVQGTGDVILQVYRNDLTAHPVTSPLWQTVPGMEGPFQPSFAGFVDDTLSFQTGSLPLNGGGVVGYGAAFKAPSKAVYFDHVSIDRQI